VNWIFFYFVFVIDFYTFFFGFVADHCEESANL